MNDTRLKIRMNDTRLKINSSHRWKLYNGRHCERIGAFRNIHRMFSFIFAVISRDVRLETVLLRFQQLFCERLRAAHAAGQNV